MIILDFFFLFLHKTICCGYSLEAPRRGASNEYPQHMVLWRIGENYPRIIIKYSSLTIPLVAHVTIRAVLFCISLTQIFDIVYLTDQGNMGAWEHVIYIYWANLLTGYFCFLGKSYEM